MTTEIGGLVIQFGDERQPKALPLSHPKARWGDFGTETILLKKGTQRRWGSLPLPCDILFERDQPVLLRDNTKIFVDVYRPVEADVKVPALMAWSPYGKQGGRGNQVLDDFPFRMGVPVRKLSEFQKWEAPDPAYWVLHGYAVVNPDARGVGKSEGDIYNFGSQEGRDGADVIEWIGSRPWCNGKVSMSGNSYLAISQWFIAAQRPKYLACIAPWEGLSDLYRESGSRGGVPSLPALNFLLQLLQVNAGENSWENTVAMGVKHQLHSAYHADKAAKIEDIQVPAYVTASWSNPIHTYGTFRAYCRLTGDKWLRVHDSWEWPDYYDERNRTDLHRFFDYYLKGIDNGWTNTPRLRAKIIDTANPLPLTGSLFTSTTFPPAEAKPLKLFLNGMDSKLTSTYPTRSSLTYEADSTDLTYEYTFHEDTVCCGPVEARLAVSLTGDYDSNIFVSFAKVLATGSLGQQLKIPYDRQIQTSLIRTVASTGLVPMTSLLMYKGPYGQVRLSRREIDLTNDVTGFPVSRMDVLNDVKEGEIMSVLVQTTPMGMRFAAGEKLRVTIEGVEKIVFPPVDQATLTIEGMKGIEYPPTTGKGVVAVHSGLEDATLGSYIVLPVV